MGFQLNSEKPSFLMTISMHLDIVKHIINRVMTEKSKTMLDVNVWMVSTFFC